MSHVQLKNRARSTLATSITAATTVIQIGSADADKFPALNVSGDCFYAALIDVANNVEFVKAVARNGNQITVERGVEDTTARTFSAGDRIELRVTAEAWNTLSENTWSRPVDSSGTVLLPTMVNGTTFTVSGDRRAFFSQYRAVRLHQDTIVTGFVGSSSYSSSTNKTTVTVTDVTVKSGLQVVECGVSPDAAPKRYDAVNADHAINATNADDAGLLKGKTSTHKATPLTVVERTGSGDIISRQLLAEHLQLSHGVTCRKDDSVFYSAANADDKYIRRNDKSGMQKALGLEPGIDIPRMSDIAGVGGKRTVFTKAGRINPDGSFEAGVKTYDASKSKVVRVICVGAGKNAYVGKYGGGGISPYAGGAGEALIDLSSVSGNISVTVGVASTASLGNGGPSSFGSYLTANGGSSVAGYSSNAYSESVSFSNVLFSMTYSPIKGQRPYANYSHLGTIVNQGCGQSAQYQVSTATFNSNQIKAGDGIVIVEEL